MCDIREERAMLDIEPRLKKLDGIQIFENLRPPLRPVDEIIDCSIFYQFDDARWV